MILVDTSIWVDHLRIGEAALITLLDRSQVIMHPFVTGELACGNLHNRAEILGLLDALPQVRVASDDEVLHLIESQTLMGRGIGLIDVHLIASVLLEDHVQLWTRDKRLHAVAESLDLCMVNS